MSRRHIPGKEIPPRLSHRGPAKPETFRDATRYAPLGSPAPYCIGTDGDGRYTASGTLPAAIGALATPPAIDVVGLTEMINRGYCFGARTLIRGIRRCPAAAELRGGEVVWLPLPKHGARRLAPGRIARGLFDRLCRELESVCRTRSRIGLLLSGGMDSRVVACALARLQREARISATVIALTWGIDGCRDVEYAARVAGVYGWESRYFPLTAQGLEQNIAISGMRGAEYSPVHLHAMPEIGKQTDLDLVLAASFGDSVGRAEFSGSHVGRISSIRSHIYNRFKLLDTGVFRQAHPGVHEDAELYEPLMVGRGMRQRREVDRQLHYMQRMLVPCMESISDAIPLYQAFTSPDVYGFMWALSPDCRDDRVYHEILSHYDSALLQIPWARTGRPYLGQDVTVRDALSRHNNHYGRWLRTGLRDVVRERVLSREISQLRMFNMQALEVLLRRTEAGSNDKATPLQEILAWVASVAELVERFDIQGATTGQSGALRRCLDGRILSRAHALAFDCKISVQSALRKRRL